MTETVGTPSVRSTSRGAELTMPQYLRNLSQRRPGVEKDFSTAPVTEAVAAQLRNEPVLGEQRNTQRRVEGYQV